VRLLLEDIMDVLRVLSGDNARSKIDRARDAWAIVGTHPLSGRAEVAANRQSNHVSSLKIIPECAPSPRSAARSSEVSDCFGSNTTR
jgi:hypothetical protein